MFIYIFLITFLICCCMLEVCRCSWKTRQPYGRENKIRIFFLFLTWFFIVLYGFFRSEKIGYDCGAYDYYYFSPVDSVSWVHLFTKFDISEDNGFCILTKLIKVFTKDYWIYRGIIFTFVTTVYFIIFYKELEYVSFGALFYVVFFSAIFYWLRMFFAMSLFAIAKRQMKREHMLLALIIILIAFTIHKSAALCLIPWILKICTKRKLSLFSILAILFVCFIVVVPFMRVFAVLYKSGDYDESNGGYGLFAFYLGVYFIIVFFIYKRKINAGSYFVFEYNTMSIALVIQSMALVISIITRFTVYFFEDAIFIISKIIASYKKYESRLIILCLFLGIVIFYCFRGAYFPEYKFHAF